MRKSNLFAVVLDDSISGGNQRYSLWSNNNIYGISFDIHIDALCRQNECECWTHSFHCIRGADSVSICEYLYVCMYDLKQPFVRRLFQWAFFGVLFSLSLSRACSIDSISVKQLSKFIALKSICRMMQIMRQTVVNSFAMHFNNALNESSINVIISWCTGCDLL